MRSLEEMLRENNPENPDDIDALPELAEIVGVLIRDERYPNIFLVTEENFDTKDNDFIRYKLQFKTSQ